VFRSGSVLRDNINSAGIIGALKPKKTRPSTAPHHRPSSPGIKGKSIQFFLLIWIEFEFSFWF